MSHMSEAHVHMMEKLFHDEEDWKNQVSNFVQRREKERSKWLKIWKQKSHSN